jgi:hypothetical protein
VTGLVFQFVRGFGAGLGGNDCGGHYHSNKCEGDQEVMHCFISLYGSMEPVYILMMAFIGKYLNPTNKAFFGKGVLWG